MSLFLIILSIVAIAFYPISITISLFLGVATMIVAFLALKDKVQIKKVAQVTTLLLFVVVIGLCFDLIADLLFVCGSFSANYYASDFARLVTVLRTLFNLIEMLATIAALVIAIVFLLAKKDIPVVKNLVDFAIDGKKIKKEEKKQDKSNDKQDTEEAEDKEQDAEEDSAKDSENK